MVLALTANQLLSSGTHLIAKATVGAIGPLSVSLLRFTGASIALLAHQRARGLRRFVDRSDIPRFLLLGLLVVPVNQGGFLFGLARSTPSHAALLYALTPLVVLVLSRVLLGEGRVWSKLAGIAVAFSGVAAILTEKGIQREAGVFFGDLLLLAAVIAWALYTVLSKRLLTRYDPMAVTAWSIVAGTILCLPAFAIPGAIPPLSRLTPPVWGGLLYLSIGTSAIAYPLWMYALKHLPATKVAVATNLQPVMTGTLSWLIFRERFTPVFLLGAALILVGVTWVGTRRDD